MVAGHHQLDWYAVPVHHLLRDLRDSRGEAGLRAEGASPQPTAQLTLLGSREADHLGRSSDGPTEVMINAGVGIGQLTVVKKRTMNNNTAVTPHPAGDTIKDKVKPRSRPKGPKVAAIVVVRVAMLFAGLIIAKAPLSWRVDWSRLGPEAIVGISVVMMAIGAIGLVRGHDNG